VKDTGKGIAEAELPLIFERFYQAEEGKKYMAGGSGIGLSLARDYAELMQGHIEVESKRSVGSKFVFTMPKVHGALNMDALPLEPSQIAAASDLEDLSAPVLSRRHSLLIVEDNPQLATFLSSILAPDYEILLAGNGEEALVLLAGHQEISLVLTDLMMPVMDGFALIHRLRTDPRFFSIPVMVLTARSGREERLLGVACRRGRLHHQAIRRGRAEDSHPQLAPSCRGEKHA
jgi:CheY-like chemotaxis protein